jgi:hypothetical protein
VSFVICCEDNTCTILVTLFTPTIPKFEESRSQVLGMVHTVFARCSHYSMCIGFFFLVCRVRLHLKLAKDPLVICWK